MKKLILTIVVVFLILGCGKKDDSKVVAEIDGEKITLNEFNKELDKIPTELKMLVATEMGKRAYLERLIMKRLLLKEAKKEKIEKDKEFQEKLAEIREQLLIDMLVKKRLEKAEIKEEEIRKYYEENKEQFKKPPEINTRHILLRTAEEAKQIQERLSKGEDFVELAKKYSIDPAAKTTGGEIGYHPKGTLVPEYEEEAFKLKKVGQISGIVKTRFGYHIIRLEGIKPPSYASYEEVREIIRQKLLQEKRGKMLEDYFAELKNNAKIKINEEVLKEERIEKREAPKPEEKPKK
ncbi:MAG: peptidylprolyl isomerase [Desulfobacterota bacterium]|nr:peptidylprolyl isomerase [Thermodesulfobacteriota bacterium]MDW8001288.1 peptidylprolyl isomerase [Deltaproteobacteria bacterium]